MKWKKVTHKDEMACKECGAPCHTEFTREDGLSCCGRDIKRLWQEGDVTVKPEAEAPHK